MLRETVLLFNTSSVDRAHRIEQTCIQMGFHIKRIPPEQYQVPVGFLAYGTEEQQKSYLLEKGTQDAFEKPMMVLAGITGPRVNGFLNRMRKNKAPKIALKAILTESNAEWDAIKLHGELSQEDDYMTGKATPGTDNV